MQKKKLRTKKMSTTQQKPIPNYAKFVMGGAAG